VRPLEWATLATVFGAGYFAVTALVIPAAALALMLDTVFGRAYRLRRSQGEPLSSKSTTYLVMGGLGWLLAAWVAYLAGAFVRTAV